MKNYLAYGLFIFALGCPQAPNLTDSGETPIVVSNSTRDSPQSEEKGKKMGSAESLVSFEFNDDGRQGFRVLKTGEFVSTLPELSKALPDFPRLAREDERYIPELSYVLYMLVRGTDGIILQRADVEEKYLKHVDREDPLQEFRWRTAVSAHGPEPSLLVPPKWDGETLVVTSVEPISGMQTAFSGNGYRFVFGAEGWSYERFDLDTTTIKPEKALAAIHEAFGGAVEGFIRVNSEPGSYGVDAAAVYAGLGPSEGAARWVYRSPDKNVERFADWSSLRAKTRAFDSSAELGRLAQELYLRLVQERVKHDNYRVILDPEVYRQEYRAEGRDTHKLRYWVDEIRETAYVVKDFDQVAAPALEGATLVAYFEDGRRQPNRLEIPLDNLNWNVPLDMVKLYEERLIHDSRDGLMPRPADDVPLPLKED